jgi:hypothetical protein
MDNAWFWTLCVTSILLLPFLVVAITDIVHKPKEILFKQHFKDSINAIINNLFQTLFTLTCLPYEAYYTLDAIIRTNWRVIFSRKNYWNGTPHPTIIKSLRRACLHLIGRCGWRLCWVGRELYISVYMLQ